MTQPVSLVEALKPRALKILTHITKRMPGRHQWANYHPDEGLTGELRVNPPGGVFIEYSRPGHPHAKFLIWKPEMTNIVKVERDEPKIIEAKDPERVVKEIDIGEGTGLQTTLSHTFSKTTSLSQAVKASVEAYTKVSAGGDLAGVKISAEVGLKLYAEYSRTWGESETQSNTESQTLTLNGPRKVRYEATRTLNTEERVVRALTDFDFDIALIDDTKGSPQEPSRIDIGSSWTSFKQTVRGLSPAEYGFYETFINNKLSQEEFDDMIKPPEYYVEFTVRYDSVVHQTINVINED